MHLVTDDDEIRGVEQAIAVDERINTRTGGVTPLRRAYRRARPDPDARHTKAPPEAQRLPCTSHPSSQIVRDRPEAAWGDRQAIG
jgi:hypothetical protein